MIDIERLDEIRKRLAEMHDGAITFQRWVNLRDDILFLLASLEATQVLFWWVER